MRDALNQGLIDFLNASPTPFHATASIAQRLEAAGFQPLDERQSWSVEAGGRYYVTRNDSSIIAIQLGRRPVLEAGVRLVGAHTDSPCLRVKPQPELQRQGAEYGAEATLRAAEEANHFEPELHTHSPAGDRIDQVRFHPAWHQMMTIARRNGISNLPFTDKRQTAWAAYGASLFMHSQIESGSTCPTTMTKASIPLVRINPQLNAVLGPLLESGRELWLGCADARTLRAPHADALTATVLGDLRALEWGPRAATAVVLTPSCGLASWPIDQIGPLFAALRTAAERLEAELAR